MAKPGVMLSTALNLALSYWRLATMSVRKKKMDNIWERIQKGELEVIGANVKTNPSGRPYLEILLTDNQPIRMISATLEFNFGET